MACPLSYLCFCLLSLSLLCLLPLNHSAPLSTRLLPQFLPPLSAVVVAVAVAPPAFLSLFGTKLHARLVDCCLEGLHPCPAPSTRSSLPPLGSCHCPCRGRPLIVVFGPPPCPRWPDLRPPSQLSSSRRHPCCGRATTAEAVAAQRLWLAAQRWQCSDGSVAMTAQRWQRRWRRSDGDGGAAMATAAQRRQQRQ